MTTILKLFTLFSRLFGNYFQVKNYIRLMFIFLHNIV